MNNIVRKFNQNRKMICLYIFIFVCIIIGIQVVNYVIKKQNENKSNETNNIQNISSYEKRTSTLTEKTVNEKINDKNIEIIDKFIKLCNEKKPEEAYSLISDDCKKQKFPSKDDFIKNYYESFFDTEKKYEYEIWINKGTNYTYKIKLYNDNLMQTGGKETSYIEEYYTIKQDKYENKININGFINTASLNQDSSNMNINISVKEKNTFMEFETYIVEIKNNTQNDILIDSKENTDTMYIEDDKENKYPCYSHEISQDKLILKAKETRKVKIKYTKQYTSTLETKKMVFADIILNYNEYKEKSNKKEYKNRCEISIDL